MDSAQLTSCAELGPNSAEIVLPMTGQITYKFKLNKYNWKSLLKTRFKKGVLDVHKIM